MPEKQPVSLIETITKRLANLQDGQLICVPDEANKSKLEITVVGEMTDHLKRLYTLRIQLATEGIALFEPTKDGKTEENQRRAVRTMQLTELVDKLFWLEIQHQFPELTGESIAIRPPWKVGLLGVTTENSFEKLFAMRVAR
jgi:hypothetical protein